MPCQDESALQALAVQLIGRAVILADDLAEIASEAAQVQKTIHLRHMRAAEKAYKRHPAAGQQRRQRTQEAAASGGG